MQSKFMTRLLAASLLAGLAVSTGCASSDIDQLRSELADVRAIANEAKSAADEAKQEAAEAKAEAAEAKAAADEAKAMAQDNTDRIDRMFKKAMTK